MFYLSNLMILKHQRKNTKRGTRGSIRHIHRRGHQKTGVTVKDGTAKPCRPRAMGRGKGKGKPLPRGPQVKWEGGVAKKGVRYLHATTLAEPGVGGLLCAHYTI